MARESRLTTTFGKLPSEQQAELLRRYVTESPAALAREYGVGLNSLYQAAKGRNVAHSPPRAEAPTVFDARLLAALKKGRLSVLELCDRFEVAPKVIRGAVAHLREQGFEVAITEEGVDLNTAPVLRPEERSYSFGGDSLKVGIVSDTHLGSKYQQRTVLHEFMHWAAEDEKVDVFLHAGDLVQGTGMYKGCLQDTFAVGADEQRDYAIEHYPRTGKPTIIISGNHDQSFQKADGFNIVAAVARQRDDIQYVGASGAYVNISGVAFYLWHPSGGLAYAKSYRLQREISGFAGGAKPDVVIAGHWHVYAKVVERNVYGFLAPCFQSQTPYELEKGLAPQVGGIVLEVWTSPETRGIVRLRETHVPFYVPQAHDY